MAANIEFQLLSKIIETGDLKTVLNYGIDASKFGSSEARLVFEDILSYYNGRDTRNLVPTLDIIEENHPALEMPHPGRLTVKALCKELIQSWKRRKIEEIIEDASSDLQDPDVALNGLMEGLRNLRSSNGIDDKFFAASGDELERRYLFAKEVGGLIGLPYPKGWGYMDDNGRPKLNPNGSHKHPMNEATRGIQREHLTVVYGRPKSMKTWILVDILDECYSRQNCKCLFFSGEMGHLELMERTAARIARVSYEQVLSGKLSQDDEEDYLYVLRSLNREEKRLRKKGKNAGILFTSAADSGTSLSARMSCLISKIDEYDPDIVLADSIYTAADSMSKKAHHEQIRYVCGTLKEQAKSKKIPIVVSTQANRKGDETKGTSMSELAFSDAFGQYADEVFRTVLLEQPDGSLHLTLVVTGARQFKFPGILLDVEPATRFNLIKAYRSTIQLQAVFKAEAEAMAKEEQEAANEINKRRHLKTDSFQKRKDGYG